MDTHDARGYLAWTLLGNVIFFLRSLYYKGEVIGVRLFRATGLAFAIRPKDGVARQGRRGGFHCYCPKACWNNFIVLWLEFEAGQLYSKFS